MQRNIHLSIALAALLCAPISGCSEDTTGPAYLTLEEGAYLPCLGVKRFRVIVTDGKSEKISDNFGDYYDQEGHCKLPIYLLAAFDGLTNTSTMLVRVEGFDSSEKRRMSSGVLGPVSKADADTGHLGTLAIDREPVNEGGQNRYPTGTVVMTPLERIDEVEKIESLAFILNPGTTYAIHDGLYTDPEAHYEDLELVISSLLPFDDPGSLIVVARYKQVSVGQWSNANALNIKEADMFVEVTMAKEPW